MSDAPDASDLISAATRYHDALTAAMPLAGMRSLADGPTQGELLLESQWARDLQPALGGLYWQPIADGLPTMMTQSRGEIVRSVLELYSERTELIDPLRGNLRGYVTRGFNLGGQMGLQELELLGQFEVTDERLTGQIDGHVGRLVSTQRRARMSLAVTTAEEIGDAVVGRRDALPELSDLLTALAAWALTRTIIRSALIAATESVRASRWGMLCAFAGNGIRGVRHECEPDVERVCTTGLCPPLCGREYALGRVFNPMSDVPAEGRIPLHPRCRCWYSSLRDGWVKPALIWSGFALDAFDD